jgi:hypothetical protein
LLTVDEHLLAIVAAASCASLTLHSRSSSRSPIFVHRFHQIEYFQQGAVFSELKIAIARSMFDRKQTIIGMITPVTTAHSIWLVRKYYG